MTISERTVESSYDSITRVMTVQFANGENNYFDIALLGELIDAIEAAKDAGARAVVVASLGKHFCAGMNFQPTNLIHGDGAHIYDDIVPRFFAQPLPVVAAVDGAAIGGGFGLALSADFRVASPVARFAANFAQIGISQGFATTMTLPRAVGNQRAAEILYTGRRLTGDEAYAMGVCDRLVEAGRVLTEAEKFAAEIASSGPLAIESMRRALREPILRELPAVLALERSEQDRLRSSSDFAEGVLAYRERRPPIFLGQ